MSEFRMPTLGADMESGIVAQWLVKPGDRVKRGQIIVIIETHKGAFEVEIFEDGEIAELLVAEGTRAPVGTVLAQVRAASQTVAQPAAVPPSAPAPVSPRPSPTPAAAPPAAAAHPAAPPAVRPGVTPQEAPAAPLPKTVRASPAARRMAEALHVDLARVTGSGPRGAIRMKDVELAARAVRPPDVPPAAAPSAERLTGMRQAIAAAVTRSKREIPHYYMGTVIEMTRVLDWLQSENERRSLQDRLLPAVLLIKAVALAVRAVPEMNGFWQNGGFQKSNAIHVGVAISLREGGLFAPAIHDTDRLSVDALMKALRELVERTRAGRLRGSELTDPTITVTNLGDRGVDSVFGIIHPPQVAIVGFGRIVERPWALNGALAVRPTVTASLAADHRASDGHRGGLFLSALEKHLQEPEKL